MMARTPVLSVVAPAYNEAEGIEEMIGKTRVINVGRKGKIIDI